MSNGLRGTFYLVHYLPSSEKNVFCVAGDDEQLCLAYSLHALNEVNPALPQFILGKVAKMLDPFFSNKQGPLRPKNNLTLLSL